MKGVGEFFSSWQNTTALVRCNGQITAQVIFNLLSENVVGNQVRFGMTVDISSQWHPVCWEAWQKLIFILWQICKLPLDPQLGHDSALNYTTVKRKGRKNSWSVNGLSIDLSWRLFFFFVFFMYLFGFCPLVLFVSRIYELWVPEQ